MSKNKANLLLLLVALVWGSGFVVTQVALDAQITPFQIIAGRFSVGALVLNLFFLKKFKTLKKQDIIAGSIVGTFLLLGFVFQGFGQKYSTPSICAFVTATSVVFVPFIDWRVFKRWPDTFAVVGALLTVIGVGLISITDSISIGIGILLTLISAICYAFQLSCNGHFVKKCDPVHLTITSINFTAIVGIIITACNAVIYKDLPPLSAEGIGALLFLGIFSTAVCFLGQSVGQRYTSSTKAAVILSTEAVFGTILSVLIYKEVLNLRTIIGCSVVFIAIMVAETKLEFLKINQGGFLNGRQQKGEQQ